MKLFITFFILVAVSCVSIEAATVNAEGVLKFLRTRVESVSSELQSYNQNLTEKLTHKLQTKVTTEWNKINSSTTAVRQDAEEKNYTATAEGKNVTQCLEKLETVIHDSTISVNDSMKSCVNSSFNDLSKIQGKVEEHLKLNASIVEQLDKILVDCKNDEGVISQSCIAKKIPSVTATVGSFYLRALTLRGQEKIFILTSPLKASICITKAVVKFNLSLRSGKKSLAECIDNTKIEEFQ